MRALPPLLALAAGVLLHDCVLLACAALLGLRAFHLAMDGAAPLPVWRVVARSWAAGWAALVVAALLLIQVASVMAGWWSDANAKPWLAFVSLAAAVALAAAIDRGARAWLAAGLALAGVTWVAHGEGWEGAPCVFAIASAVVVAAAGWQLARAAAEGLLEAEGSR